MRSAVMAAVATLVAGTAGAALAGDYSLFDPTPTDAMRDFMPDRPNKTDGPFTVDPGHFQVEADLFTRTWDNRTPDGSRVRAFTAFVPNIRTGLYDKVEIDLFLPAYTDVRTSNPDSHAHGLSDMMVRAKVNFWGNDGGTTGLGLIPFLSLPTGAHDISSGGVEGGVSLPFNVNLSEGWGVGVQAGMTVNRNAESGHNLGYVGSVSLNHDLSRVVAGYVELYGARTTGPDTQTVSTLDIGVSYKLGSDFSVDTGVNIGLNRAADDVNPFIGFSYRY